MRIRIVALFLLAVTASYGIFPPQRPPYEETAKVK